MTDSPKKPGTFTSDSAKAARAKGKGKKERGLAGKVRKHRDEIVAGMLEIARKSKSETARARMWDSLARIGWGTPATAEQMGAVEPVDPMAEPQGHSPHGTRGHRCGIVILPSEEINPPDYSRLTDDELRTLERLRCKARGEEPGLSVEEQLALGRRQQEEWHRTHPATEPLPVEPPHELELENVLTFPVPPSPAGLDTTNNDGHWPGKDAS